ncbi:MAG: cupin domain-containing protein [Bacteroidota bacterium]
MNIFGKTLVDDTEIAWEELSGGLKRKIMSYDNDVMLMKVAFEKGGIGTLHSHPHKQISYIAKGKFEVTIGEDTKILSEGDVYFAPSSITHGVVCLEEGLLIDVFNPMREDLIK